MAALMSMSACQCQCQCARSCSREPESVGVAPAERDSAGNTGNRPRAPLATGIDKSGVERREGAPPPVGVEGQSGIGRGEGISPPVEVEDQGGIGVREGMPTPSARDLFEAKKRRPPPRGQPTQESAGPQDDEDGYDENQELLPGLDGVVTEEEYGTLAYASAEPTEGGAPLTVQFLAEVIDPPPGARVEWAFGDGSGSAGQVGIRHTYAEPGNYTVVLSVVGSSGVLAADFVAIEVTEEAFVVDVEAEPDSGPAPLVVTLQAQVDLDEVDHPQGQWDFGDGTAGGGLEVQHVYERPGRYTAVAIVTNGAGQHGRAEVDIDVSPPGG